MTNKMEREKSERTREVDTKTRETTLADRLKRGFYLLEGRGVEK
jgi:hypothetical protein